MRRKVVRGALSLVLLVACGAAGRAQEVSPRPVTGVEVGREGQDVRPPAPGLKPEEAGGQSVLPDTSAAGTARWTFLPSLPPPCLDGAAACFPASWQGGYGCGLWELHEGFNAGVGMSVSASFGRGRFPGVGFGTGISAMYVRRLAGRLALSAGGSYDRLSWNGLNGNRLGIDLLAGFQLTGRVSLYAYGGKAFFPMRGRRSRMCSSIGRFGGMVHFKASDAVSVSVSVEETRR